MQQSHPSPVSAAPFTQQSIDCSIYRIHTVSVFHASMDDFKYNRFPLRRLKSVSLQALVTLSFLKNGALKEHLPPLGVSRVLFMGLIYINIYTHTYIKCI